MIPPIEVLIPCRNAPAALWLTLTHLVAHADCGEVKAVTLLDNRSTASGMDYVFSMAKNRGMRVIRHEENVGVWASVNRGLALARAPWVVVLTSDVLLGPSAISILSQVMDQARGNLVHLGPLSVEGPDALRAVPGLACPPGNVTVNTAHYNGAVWLMRWDVLRECVGWFDPNYYVSFGDVDYVERIRLAGLVCGVVPELLCIHLDKQTRRHDHTAQVDSDVDVRDSALFRAKWQDNPEVLAQHPQLSVEQYIALKGGEAGWRGGKKLL